MTVRDVYQKQQVRARLDQEARTLTANDPDYPKLAATIVQLNVEIAAEQEAVGGVVYRVANANLDTLRTKLDALNKRAAKHDLGKILYYVTDEVDVVDERAPWDPEACADLGVSPLMGGEVIAVKRYTYVVLQAPRLEIGGWSLLAKLSVEEAGVFVAKVPAFARAWARHRTDGNTPGWDIDTAEEAAHAELEALNLADYANPETATRCDHCGLSRRRTATYVVEHIETGDRKQVGSNCLADFLGVDPHNIIRNAEWLRELSAALDSDEDGGYGYAPSEVPVESYLTHVCTMIRVNGWASKSTSGHPTSDQADQNRYYYLRRRHGKSGDQLWEDPTDADVDRARAALAWADDHLGALVNQSGTASDFDRNLYVAAKATVVTPRIQGTLAYLPVAHARFLEREIERQRRDDEHGASEYVGTVGDRTELTLQVTHVFETEGRYGTTWITVLRDGDSNAYKWFGSKELERGETYVGRWTIKNHEEYKGAKQTIINRPVNLRVADTAQAQIEVAS